MQVPQGAIAQFLPACAVIKDSDTLFCRIIEKRLRPRDRRGSAFPAPLRKAAGGVLAKLFDDAGLIGRVIKHGFIQVEHDGRGQVGCAAGLLDGC